MIPASDAFRDAPPHAHPDRLHLARVARDVSRAFDDALVEAGGSLPVWLVLISVKGSQGANQRELAGAFLRVDGRRVANEDDGDEALAITAEAA